MKSNNKGFTFVEILAVIVIIGILMSISIVAYSRYKDKAKNNDYEALAKSSYNAMEEYMMSHPYENDATLEKLVDENLLSNRQDPGSKDTECEGTVIVDKTTGSGGTLDEGKYKVYLCCASYKKMYTYPGGEVSNIDDPNKCKAAPSPGGGGESTIICSPGLYLQKSYTVCTQCPSGSFCPGGTFRKNDTKDQGINACPNCYKNSNAGSSLITHCYSKVNANNHVKTKNECPVACPTGQNREAHNVFYGQTSTCTNEKITVTFNCSPGKASGGATTATRTYQSNATGQKFNVTCTRTGYQQPSNKAWKNSKTNDTYKLNSGVSVTFIHNNKPSVTVNALWEVIKVDCKPGQYLPKASTSCTTCTAGNYCPGGKYPYDTTKAQGITTCPKCYKNSKAGSSSINQCYSNVNANYYVKTRNECSVACPSGQNSQAQTVYYGKVSTCKAKTIEVTFNCNGGTGGGKQTFKTGVTGQKFTTKCSAASNCQTQDGWKRDKNGKAKNYETGSSVSDNFIITYSPKITLYAHWTGKSTKCEAGYYLKKGATTCTKCEAGYYCPGNTYTCSTSSDQGKTKCPNCYTNSPAGSSKQSDCYAKVNKNNYVKTANACPVSCPSGQYKEAHEVKHGKVSSCSNKSIAVTFDCNGGTISAGSSPVTYYTNTLGKFTTKCSKAGSSQDGWKKVKTATKKDYSTDSNVTENWILTNAPKITLYANWTPVCVTCAAGTYLPSKSTTCSSCKAGYYCLGGKFCYGTPDQGLSSCPNGYKYSAAGSSKEASCYMSVSANKYVKTAKASSATACGAGQTKPAHNVYYGNTSSCNWTSYTISYNLNSGSVSGNPTSYTANSAAFTLKNPTRSGYIFEGWTGTGLSGKTKTVTIAKGSTGNRSYTANWYKLCSSKWNPKKDEVFGNCGSIRKQANIKMFRWYGAKKYNKTAKYLWYDLAVYACNCTMDSVDHGYACSADAKNVTKCHHTYLYSIIGYTSESNRNAALNGTHYVNSYVDNFCNHNPDKDGLFYHSYKFFKGGVKDGWTGWKGKKASVYTIGKKTTVDGNLGADTACKKACEIYY